MTEGFIQLEIGDWVKPKKSAWPFKVSGITEQGVTKEGPYYYKYDEVEPISLTSEILKRIGFQYYHKNFASLSFDHPFQLEMVEWPDENGLGGIWRIGGILRIRFVHELQHAFRLYGINKYIEL